MRAANTWLGSIGTTVFTVMSALATEHKSINLGQGFPDTDGPADVLQAAADALHDGRNQYPPMPGVPELRAAVAAANSRSTLFCQIETAAGVENADEIAAIEGVDALWVGHFDLSVSLGIPGEFDHPDFRRAIDRTIAACKKHGKALGRLVPTVEVGVELCRAGFDFICYSGDVWVLHNALAEAIARLREGAEAKRS